MCDCEERDFVTFVDDDGNEFELDVIDYFDYEGNEYAILIDPNDNCECEEDEECDCETSIYIMKIIVNEEDDTEEFVSPADEDMENLIEIASTILEEGCECDCDCDCDDEDCDCGDDGCECGCHKE